MGQDKDVQINPTTISISRGAPSFPPKGSVTYADEHLREGSTGILGHVDGWDHPVPLLPPQTFGAVPARAGEQDDRRRRWEWLLQLPSLRNFILLFGDL